jgi:hypothetical protein
MKLGMLGALMLMFAAPAAAQVAKPLFASDAPIHLTIRGPMRTLTGTRSSDARPAVIATDAGETLPVTLAVRGITRRQQEICDFPPLKVEFARPPTATSLFAGQHKLKLVTHCKNQTSFQQKVLLEYAAYRMFNQLSPRSFRVRLANIDYQTDDGRPVVSRIGFFIEDLGDVARRNGMRQTHAAERISAFWLNPTDAARYALFQDMIANHDWDMKAGPQGEECCHNAKLIGPGAPGSVVPIPYDFDFSGLVDAPYSSPPDVLNLSSVRDRLYRGYCIHNGQALAVAAQMRAAQPQLFATLASTPGLDPGTIASAERYLGGFFAMIATDRDVQTRVLRSCVS